MQRIVVPNLRLYLIIILGWIELAPCARLTIAGDGNRGVLLSRIGQIIENKGRRQGAATEDPKDLYLKEPQDPNVSEDADLKDVEAKLIEKELIGALSHKKSALLDKPYIETLGKNDFLVIDPAFRDPFVTIIPNMMYYNIEKKCVNWLDDCNLLGIKSRLMKKVQSPYKK